VGPAADRPGQFELRYAGANGPFYLNSKSRFADISDARAHRGFSEHLTGDFNQAFPAI